MVKEIHTYGGKEYYLIVSKEKIARIEKLKTYKSITRAHEVYPVAVIAIGFSKLERSFLERVPVNVWMSPEEYEKLVKDYIEYLQAYMIREFRKYLSNNPVPDKPKGREKSKYPKVIYYYGYSPYKSRIVKRLRKIAKEEFGYDHVAIYRFSRSFAIDDGRRMLFLPYNVDEIDLEKARKIYGDIRYAVRGAVRSQRYSELPEDIRSVIDYISLCIKVMGED
jgi:hypothetical protein